MITDTEAPPIILRLSAFLAWTSDLRIATKLHGFAMTEQGSALDMFRAAEAATDPRHRRLFLRHAIDEARHARRFREEALKLAPDSRPRDHERRHALPQDLYRRLGCERFLAFVHLSEARAQRQFVVLGRHFARNPERAAVAALFEELAKEERFHVTYSRHLLGRLFAAEVREKHVRRALMRERRSLAWAAWKRAGARLGGRFTTLLMALVFVAVLPLFALLLRLSRRRDTTGWQTPNAAVGLADARRQA